MDERIKFFVGLDIHKDSTSIAACETGRGPSGFVGTIGPYVHGLLTLLSKAGWRSSTGQRGLRGGA